VTAPPAKEIRVRTHLLRLTVVAAQLAAAAGAALPASAALLAPAPAVPRQLALINGDRLAGGVVLPAHRGAGALLTLRANGTTYVIPAVAVPYLGHGLDPSLFDVAALQRAERAGRLPVRVSYRGRRPALPGVRITWASRGTAAGYLTASSAQAFGAALGRQYRADRARGSYGGLFGGVSIALAGPRSPAVAAYPMHTLTVTATSLAGKPDTGDYVFVWNVDNGLRSDASQAFGVFDHGVARFSVPAGHYWAVGVFGHPEIFRTAPARLVVLPQVTVAADTTVHMAERTASSKVTMVTPRPAAVQSDNFYLVRALHSGPQSVLQFSNYHSAIWVSPTSRRTTVGWLRADASQELTSAHAGAPYAYALSYAGPRGIIPPQRYVIRPAGLTTIRESYYQDATSPGYWTVYGSFPRTFNGYVEPYIYPGALPARRTVYVGGSPSADWASYYGGLGAGQGYGEAEYFRTVRPGERITDDWNRYPLHPSVNVNLSPANRLNAYLPSADRAGNMLTLEVTPFGDNQPGHLSYGFSKVPGATITGSYQIDENGQRIAGGNAARLGAAGPFYTRVRLSPKPSVISFALSAARTGGPFRLSTASRTVWTWRSSHEAGATLPPDWYCYNPASPTAGDPRHCAVEPMMALRYQVAGLALDGSAPPGRQVLTVTAGHLQLAKSARVTGASVQVSFDGGKTWHPASVTALGKGSFRATFAAPAGAVSLRTTARDAAGGSITETITRGYAVAP
jgi:hypothetical protein